MNVRELLSSLGVTFRERDESPHVTAGWVGLECPFCGRGTGKFGLGINLRTHTVSCWKCGTHRLGDTLAEATNRPLSEIIPLLPESDVLEGQDDGRVVPGRYTPPPGVGELDDAHRNYLRRRGFNPDEVSKLWGVRGIGMDGGYYKWRLFIPVTFNGKDVSWTTRAVGRIEPRYLSAPPEAESRPLKQCLFGEDKCGHTIVVMEGLFGVMRVGPGGAATFGLTVTPTQVARIARFPRRVIAFDNEPEAQRRASALADSLSIMPGETIICRLSGDDPDTAPLEEIDELRRTFLE